jgi:5-methylcytosine-specific restriction endonuclease McrA
MADTENARPIISRQAAKDAGLTRYYTGIPCVHGHVSDRHVSSRTCSLCLARNKKSYYLKNRQAEVAKVKAYYRANREKIRARGNAYDKANPEKKKALFKAWYDRNRDAWLAKKAADRKANPATFKARYKRWSEANPEHVLANIRRREARKKAAVGHHTGAEIKNLFKQQGGRCAYCRVALKRGYHADHIIPISRGGSNWISNIQLTCSDCNHRKWAKDPIEWAKQIGRLL